MAALLTKVPEIINKTWLITSSVKRPVLVNWLHGNPTCYCFRRHKRNSCVELTDWDWQQFPAPPRHHTAMPMHCVQQIPSILPANSSWEHVPVTSMHWLQPLTQWHNLWHILTQPLIHSDKLRHNLWYGDATYDTTSDMQWQTLTQPLMHTLTQRQLLTHDNTNWQCPTPCWQQLSVGHPVHGLWLVGHPFTSLYNQTALFGFL